MQGQQAPVEHILYGGMLTKYDLGRYMKTGGAMNSLVEISRPRASSLCSRINDIYRFIYLSDIFEQFMTDRKIAIKDSYKIYW